MSWKRLDNLAGIQHRRRGLSPALEAGTVCKRAETLYPDLFEAVSYRTHVLHLRVKTERLMEFKLIEGELIATLNREKITIQRIQLTIAIE